MGPGPSFTVKLFSKSDVGIVFLTLSLDFL